MKYLMLLSCLTFISLAPSRAQVIRFQSAGGGGTTPGQASNGSITHFGAVSEIVSQGDGYHNQSGFFFANLDFRPALQASALEFSSSSTNNATFDATVTWANGNGARRIVVVRRGSAVEAIPVDGTAYQASAAFGNGTEIGTDQYVVYDGIGSSVTVTGLTNDVYHYKVFEYNGLHGNNAVNIVYQPNDVAGNPAAFSAEPTARPTAINFSEIVATSMTGTFPLTGSTGYLVLRKEGSMPTEIPVDGTTYTDAFGSSTVVHKGSGDVFTSGGLAAATTYHYALYAYNGSGPTINYLSADPLRVSKITVPDAPVAVLSNATSSNFNVEWTSMPSATSYRVDVAEDDEFTRFVGAYKGMDVAGTLLNISGLQASSQYFVRIRAVNESGESANSETKFITTQSFAGTPMSLNVSQSLQTSGTTISATISGGSGDATVKFFSKGIRSTEGLSESQMTRVSDSRHELTIPRSAISDELGLEFEVEARDASGTKTSAGYLYLPIPSSTPIAGLPFGGKVTDYRIISIPYSLTLSSTAIVFSALGGYDKSQWRLLNWNGSSYIDNPPTITAGQGYWFNALTKPTIVLGEGTVVQNNQSLPFPLSLRQGWNMIATPYPFNVRWSDVLEYNGNPELSDYYVYNGTGFTTSDDLEPWKGGFVFADHALTLQVPVVLAGSSGGRKNRHNAFSAVPGDSNWIVPITLKQGETTSGLNAFGMHEEASASKDRFDAVALPAFLDLPELATYHSEYFAPQFVRDVVPTQSTYVWTFLLNTDSTEEIELSWDNEPFGNGDAQLFLHDRAAGKLVDMRVDRNYKLSVTRNRTIEFIFSAEEGYRGTYEPGTAYPNPFATETNLPAFLNTSGSRTTVSVSITDPTGVEIYIANYSTVSDGMVQPIWKGDDSGGNPVAPGVYLYRVKFTDDVRTNTIRGKVVKR